MVEDENKVSEAEVKKDEEDEKPVEVEIVENQVEDEEKGDVKEAWDAESSDGEESEETNVATISKEEVLLCIVCSS